MHTTPMPEAAVVSAFCRYLESNGWGVTTATGRDYCDVTATKSSATLYAEVKGHTSDPGTDTDTLFGQLLRRMTVRADRTTRYAVVVPEGRPLVSVLRVPAPVRKRLSIEVYAGVCCTDR